MTNPPGTPAPVTAPVSYRDLAPLEQGGRTARDGFDYQDHVAVNKCLDMLLTNGPEEVWCEAEDDIVLVWLTNSVGEFEFVQVKGTDLQQAWTVAALCAAGSGKDSKKKLSIVHKSLAHDRGLEPCRFRLVTRWAPASSLDVLLVDLHKRGDPTIQARLSGAAAAVTTSAGAFTSKNGRGVDFWAERTVWEHRARTEDVRNDNLVKLSHVLDAEGLFLAPDQCAELHANLLARVQDASLADGVADKLAKRLRRDDLRTWLRERVTSILHPAHAGATAPLQRKLGEVGVDQATIDLAIDLRRRYLAETRQQKYLSLDQRDVLEGDTLAVLHGLKARLDAGELQDNGVQFLSRSLAALQTLRATGPDAPPERLFYGYLYEVMNRCLHRLRRAAS